MEDDLDRNAELIQRIQSFIEMKRDIENDIVSIGDDPLAEELRMLLEGGASEAMPVEQENVFDQEAFGPWGEDDQMSIEFWESQDALKR